MKKINLFLAGLILLCSTSISSAHQISHTYYFVSSCGHVLYFELEDGHPPATIYNTAVYMDAQQCGPGGPVPKVYLLHP